MTTTTTIDCWNKSFELTNYADDATNHYFKKEIRHKILRWANQKSFGISHGYTETPYGYQLLDVTMFDVAEKAAEKAWKSLERIIARTHEVYNNTH